jgi:phosphopantetheinyl transferase (holo-ACP synthase)
MVRLSGGALATASAMQISRWLVSIAHSEAYALASAIAIRD